MSIFEKLGKTLGVSSKGIDVEEYMNATDMDDVDVMHEPADHYIKPVALQQQTDVELIKKELGSNNIILMNITEMAKRPNTLKAVIDDLKVYVDKMNGDIARIDTDKIILTPGKIKIIKTKRSQARA
ncbi:MAG: cell division protein SepF [Candidatus Micrarchaeaceae archaeon]